MSDFIVVGGGLLGLLTARQLTRRGASVCLLEQGEPGRESSWAGGGILWPLYPWTYPKVVQELAALSRTRYPQLCENLLEETGIDPQYRQSGLLLFGEDVLPEARSWCRENHEPFEAGVYPDAGGAGALNQGYSAFQGAACHWLPEVAQVRNPRLVKALLAALERNKSVSILSHKGVSSFTEKQGGVEVIDVQGTCHRADQLVFCTGAWTSRLLQQALPTTIKPVKGQMLLYRFEQPPFDAMLLSDGRYIIPRSDGYVLVGSTVEDSGFDKAITSEAGDVLAAFAASVSPLFSGKKPVQQWAGLRPGSSDGVPFIGRLPGYERSWVCAGHYRNGVVMAPASVERLLKQMGL